MKTYETDVLVVGGGGAATASTISASEGGARTMMAVKGRFGQPGKRGAGATSNPMADFWTIRTVGPKGGFFNPPELVHADMMQTGLGMADPALCQIFCDEVSGAVKRLRTMGMKFQSKMLATMPASEKTKGTNNIVQIQKAVIEATQTEVVEQANVVDLLVEDGRILGVVGVHDDGEPFVVHAGAVILATGGVGQLFQYSFNPPGNTGDGYAMALRAGAELFNMEFMQQGLATVHPVQVIVMLYEMEEPYRMFNAQGQSFLERYLPDGMILKEVSDLKAVHWPVTCRDAAIHLDRAIHAEALAGRATEHDGIFLDLSIGERGFQPEVFENFMRENGIDIKRDLVQAQIFHHTSNGGVRVGEHGNAGVTGLYAIGETMGWQGADRLGGTMLGGSQVFGWRAGKHAAAVAKDRPDTSAVTASVLDHMIEGPVRRMRETNGTKRPQDLKAPLQRFMWKELLVEKDAESLAGVAQYIADERERLAGDLAIAEPLDVALAFEHRNLLDVAEVITRAATLRTESRGAHYRSDFPERDDDNFMTNIFATVVDGELSLSKRWINREVGWTDQPGDVRIKPWG
ncbi:MAG: FAD-binding protein [Myxococcota bacterium]